MRCFVWVVVLVTACQPMYGAPPQKLKNPKKIAGKHEDPPEPPPPIPWVDACISNFHLPPKGVLRDKTAAADAVKEADGKLAAADKTKAPDPRRDLILDGITRYHRALAKDPYDAEATLKLALAYDRTLRKGCALAMLKRLETLANHQDFRDAAELQKAQVRDNAQWFSGYRQEALQAIP